MANPQPNDEQAQAIHRFAARHGRFWKSKLSDAWTHGKDDSMPDGALLRQLRNEFGPVWLMSLNLKTLPMAQLLPLTSDERQRMFAAIWSDTHRDFKGQFQDGTKFVMTHAKYGTGLVSLLDICDAQLRERYADHLDRKRNRNASL